MGASSRAGAANERARLRRLVRVVATLDEAYGRPLLTPRLSPLDELIYTVLSQNTADVNTDRSFAALKERFATWSAARDAPVDEIEATIALGGLAHTKAPRIKAILAALSEGSGEPDLGRLESMTDDEAQAFLVGLPGVGPKTAACVLLFSLGRPLMPVDTHVHRLARRLDLIDAGSGPRPRTRCSPRWPDPRRATSTPPTSIWYGTAAAAAAPGGLPATGAP